MLLSFEHLADTFRHTERVLRELGMTSTIVRNVGAQATKVWFAREMLWVRLADGREVGAPLEWFPRLARATATERAHLEIFDQGFGIHWPDIDEDVSVLALLGLPD